MREWRKRPPGRTSPLSSWPFCTWPGDRGKMDTQGSGHRGRGCTTRGGRILREGATALGETHHTFKWATTLRERHSHQKPRHTTLKESPTPKEKPTTHTQKNPLTPRLTHVGYIGLLSKMDFKYKFPSSIPNSSLRQSPILQHLLPFSLQLVAWLMLQSTNPGPRQPCSTSQQLCDLGQITPPL